MTPEYGSRSLKVFATLHPDLQTVFSTVLSLGFDHALIEGYRNEEDQNFAFAQGKSKVKFPNSKHNTQPSMAVDAMVWFKTKPNIDWEHTASIFHFAGIVRGVAAALLARGEISHQVRWGGDWDNDNDVREKQWDDSPHFELI